MVWNGGFRPDQPDIWDVNERRNLPLQHLKALSGINVEFISLQKGEPAESEFRQAVASGWDGPVIHDHVHELKDFSDTAALAAGARGQPLVPEFENLQTNFPGWLGRRDAKGTGGFAGTGFSECQKVKNNTF